MNKQATFVKRKDGQGEGRVYKLSPPLEGYEYVWVSAVDVPFGGPETYIFGCDQNGEVLDWAELHGSFWGDLDHHEALQNAGYTIND